MILEVKERFIQLRAEGNSFDSIAEAIGVSKPTLIKWQKEYQKEISNLTFMRVEELIIKYNLMREKRIESFLLLLNKALRQLNEVSFTGLPAKDLIQIALKLNERIEIELGTVSYRTDEFITAQDDSLQSLIRETTMPTSY